jgi:hypothetical protein
LGASLNQKKQHELMNDERPMTQVNGRLFGKRIQAHQV